MNSKNSILITQIVGLIVIVAAMFGIDIDEGTRAELIAGLSAAGLVLTMVVDKFKDYREAQKATEIQDKPQ